MLQSGLREITSTRGKSFPARSRIVGSVNGKFIIVPGIVMRSHRLLVRESYHFSPAAQFPGRLLAPPVPLPFLVAKDDDFREYLRDH
jgi:hypothetical protein